MSIFNEDDGNTNEVDVSAVTLETLVGENQKYKTPDELAKAYAHADAFVNKTKEELAIIKAEKKVLEDLVKARNNPPANDGSKQEDPPANDPPVKNENNEDLSTLIQKELERTNKEKQFADNVDSVAEKLSNHFGGERQAREAIARKAKELNVSTEWLMDIAGRSPAAFYSTVGLDQKSFSTPASQGEVNTAAFGRDTNRENFKFYEEIRKNEPRRYYSKEVQSRMFKAAREQGERFYT